MEMVSVTISSPFKQKCVHDRKKQYVDSVMVKQESLHSILNENMSQQLGLQMQVDSSLSSESFSLG